MGNRENSFGRLAKEVNWLNSEKKREGERGKREEVGRE